MSTMQNLAGPLESTKNGDQSKHTEHSGRKETVKSRDEDHEKLAQAIQLLDIQQGIEDKL